MFFMHTQTRIKMWIKVNTKGWMSNSPSLFQVVSYFLMTGDNDKAVLSSINFVKWLRSISMTLPESRLVLLVVFVFFKLFSIHGADGSVVKGQHQWSWTDSRPLLASSLYTWLNKVEAFQPHFRASLWEKNTLMEKFNGHECRAFVRWRIRWWRPNALTEIVN